MIISLYAGGMTLRDIQHHLVSTIGTELSHETISKITDQVGEEVLAWQRRPLEALYPVIYLDALVVKVKDTPTAMWAAGFLGAVAGSFVLDGADGRAKRKAEGRLEEFYRLLEGQVIDDANLFSEKLQEWEDYYNYHRPHGALDGQKAYERLRQKAQDPLSRRSSVAQGRRMRDSNPRGREPNTLSKRAP
jgi:hypothetical protein